MLPDEILLHVFRDVGDHGLVALMKADNRFTGCAVEVYRSSLENRGVLSDFLGSLKLELGPKMSTIDLSFLSTFFPLSEITTKIIIDCDFWSLLSFNQAVCRIVQRSRTLATIKVRVYSQELDLLQVTHAAPALRSLWNTIGTRGMLDSVELLCDDRNPPQRTLILPEDIPLRDHNTPILHTRNVSINTVFYGARQGLDILHSLLCNPSPSMLWVHIHPSHPSFPWEDIHLESLRSVWLTSDHHILIDSSFYKCHPNLISISTTRPYIASTTSTTQQKHSRTANRVPLSLEHLTTSPHFLWESKSPLALRYLHINAREPWNISAPTDEPKSPAFCNKVKQMVKAFRRIPIHPVHQMKVEFEFPTGVAQHCSASTDFSCSCALEGKGVAHLESLALRVDELSVPVYVSNSIHLIL